MSFIKMTSLWRYGRNHVFKTEGPIPWSRVLLLFYRKKLDNSSQFGAVGYIVTLYSSKSYIKSWGYVQILGVRTPDPQWLCPCVTSFMNIKYDDVFVQCLSIFQRTSVSGWKLSTVREQSLAGGPSTPVVPVWRVFSLDIRLELQNVWLYYFFDCLDLIHEFDS